MTASSQDLATCGSTNSLAKCSAGQNAFLTSASSNTPSAIATSHQRHETSVRGEDQSKRGQEKGTQIYQSQAAAQSTSSNKLRAQLPSNSSDSVISSSSSTSSPSSSSSAPSGSSVDDEDSVPSTSCSVIESEVFHCSSSQHQHQQETSNGEERRGEQVFSESSSSTPPGTSQALLLLQASLSGEEADDGHLVGDSAPDQQQTSLAGSSTNNDDNNGSPSKTFLETGRLSQSSSISFQKGSHNNNTEFLANQSSQQVTVASVPTNIKQSASIVYAQSAAVAALPTVVATGQHQVQQQQQQNAYYNLIQHQPPYYSQAVPHFPPAIRTTTPQSHQSGAILAASQYHHHQLHQPALTPCELDHQQQQAVYYYYPYHHHHQQQLQQQLISNSQLSQSRSSQAVDGLALGRQIDCEQKNKETPTKNIKAPITVGALCSSSSSRRRSRSRSRSISARIGGSRPLIPATCQIKAAALDESGAELPVPASSETKLLARSLNNCAQEDDNDHQFESRLAALNGSVDNRSRSGKNSSNGIASNAAANDVSDGKKCNSTLHQHVESTQLLAGYDNSKRKQAGDKNKLDHNADNDDADRRQGEQDQHEKNVKQEPLQTQEVLARHSEANSPCSQPSSPPPSRPESCLSSASSGTFMSRQQNVGPDLQPSAASTTNLGYYHDHHLQQQQQQHREYATYLAHLAQASANAARYSARCSQVHPAFYMEHLAPTQASIHGYSQQQHPAGQEQLYRPLAHYQQREAQYATFVGRPYMPAPAPIHPAPIYSMHSPLPVLLVGPAAAPANKPISAHYYHHQPPYSSASYYQSQPTATTMRSQLFPCFDLGQPPPTSAGDALSSMAIQQQQVSVVQMVPPTPIYDVSMQRCHHQQHHHQLLVGPGNMMTPQPVIAFSHQQPLKLDHRRQQQQQHFNLILLLPIDAQPASTRQAYGMDEVWQDEFERFFSQLTSSIAWTLEEVESVPNIRNSPNIVGYTGRYIVRAAEEPGEGGDMGADSTSRNASECDQGDSAADGCSNSADSEGDVGEHTLNNEEDEDDKEEKEKGEADQGLNDEKSATREEADLSQEPETQIANSRATDEQIGETESDCDSGALVNSIGSSGSETCPSEPLASGRSIDSPALPTTQQEQSLENDESNKQQSSLSAPVRKFSTRFRMFIDSAKVRFCCEHCGHGWTSMKGRVVFWYELFELVGHADEKNGPLSAFTTHTTAESYEEAGSGNSTIGYCAYKLFGQQCDVCKIEDRFERPMWYPEEVTKVLNNLYNKIGQVYFGFKTPTIDKQRRAGKPKTSHNSSLCQACHDGVCTDRK